MNAYSQALSPKILIVDDDVLVTETLGILLGELWETRTATTVDEGMEVMRSEHVSVLLSDMRMGPKSGLDLFSWALENSPNTIRILVTGFTDLNTAIQSINKGRLWHYIRKPWDNSELIKQVRSAVEHWHQTMEAQLQARGAVRALAEALEERHRDTSGHSVRVADFSKKICEAAKLSVRETSTIMLAAHLHDIGKIGISNTYLDHTDPLKTDQRDELREHVLIGERILRETGFLDEVVPLVGAHHEWWDGGGYPRGVAGESIPLGSRIIALADSYDAMSRGRSYSPPMSHQEILEECRRCAGTQFDPFLVQLLERLLPL